MKNEQKASSLPLENEADFGAIYQILKKIADRISHTIKSVLQAFSGTCSKFLKWLQKRLLLIFLFLILGVGTGVYHYVNTGPTYSSQATVHTYFKSSRFLYNYIDYLNALIKEEDFSSLGKELSMPPEDCSNIKSFHIEPVITELENANLYRATFLNFNKHINLGIDTLWPKVLSYEDFKKNLTIFDYSLHLISLVTYKSSLFANIQNGLSSSLQNSTTLKKFISSEAAILGREISMLQASILALDTLRHIYNKRIETTPLGNEHTTNQFFLGNQSARIPELELFDMQLNVKDELIREQRLFNNENEVIRFISPFSFVGSRVPFYNAFKWIYPLAGLLTGLLLALLLELRSLTRNRRKEDTITDV